MHVSLDLDDSKPGKSSDLAVLDPGQSHVAEDATLLAKRVQERGGKALYFLLGSDMPGGHHENNFDLDETRFLPGLVLFSKLVERLNG